MNNKINTFTLPIFTIKEVIPSLEKKNQVFAHVIKAESESGKIYTFIERRSMPLDKYIGRKVECVIEILDTVFYYPETEKEIKELPQDTIKGTYQWMETGYKFIPELVKIIEGDPEDENHDYDETEYDAEAGSYFDSWGEFGLGLEIYQTKPMIETVDGVYLLNEYREVEIIDEWIRNQTIYFKPIKMLLRGIKIPTATNEKRHNKAKKSIIESQDPSVYKTYNGKNYTESEWKIKEQELWEEYKGITNNKHENKKQFPPSRFLD
ncbi:hypothetical protein [Apibacter sp. HY039]|uniref:hypothetical protein n=1 Tax=Apibacter sp. HY039 TaxID=2501476 RepID=UPI000FEC09CA|nr:hypothetical protein [Apibacter sp. HY039]